MQKTNINTHYTRRLCSVLVAKSVSNRIVFHRRKKIQNKSSIAANVMIVRAYECASWLHLGINWFSFNTLYCLAKHLSLIVAESFFPSSSSSSSSHGAYLSEKFIYLKWFVEPCNGLSKLSNPSKTIITYIVAVDVVVLHFYYLKVNIQTITDLVSVCMFMFVRERSLAHEFRIARFFSISTTTFSVCLQFYSE